MYDNMIFPFRLNASVTEFSHQPCLKTDVMQSVLLNHYLRYSFIQTLNGNMSPFFQMKI